MKTYIDLTQEIPMTVGAVNTAWVEYVLGSKKLPKSIVITKAQYIYLNDHYDHRQAFLTHFRGVPLVVDGVNMADIKNS